MSRRSRVTAAGLLARHLATGRGASVVVAVIVLLTTALAAAAPRALDVLFTAEVRYTVAGIAPTQRDLVANSIGGPLLGPSEDESDLPDGLGDTFGAMEDQLATLRGDLAEPLASAVGPAQYVAISPPLPVPADEPDRDAPLTPLVLAVDPRITDRIVIAQGKFPEQTTMGELGPEGPVEIALSVASADGMRWSVGEQRTVRAGFGVVRIELTGTFDAADPTDDYWVHTPSVLEPFLFDDGNSTPSVTGTAYVNPRDVSVAGLVMGGMRTSTWFPVRADGLNFGEATGLLRELRNFTSIPHNASTASSLDQLTSFSFSSGLVGALETVTARASAISAVIAMAAAGPLGVILAVLALGARLVIGRRHSALALAGARGASPGQRRGIMAIEGLILGLPAAAIGTVAATLLIPAATGLEALALPALLGLAPAALLAAAATDASLRASRSDLGRVRGRFTWIVEVIVVALAAVAVGLLLTRGLATSDSGVTVDPLLAATPLLLALAVCVGVLRLYPVPLAAIERAVRARNGLIPSLGAARAIRDPSAGLAPVLALVVGVSVAVFSSVMVATLDRGVDAAARATVGADLRASGPVFGPAALAAIAGLDGVTATAAVDEAGPAILRIDGVKGVVTLLVVDAASLGELRPLPDGLESGGDAIPVVVSDDLELPADAKLLLEGKAIEVAGNAPHTEGVVATSRWIMIDQSRAEEVTGVGFRPHLALVDLEPGANAADVGSAIEGAVGQPVTVTTPAEAAGAIRESPAVSGLAAALTIAMALVALLCAIAVVLTSVVGARSRNRLLALLATLGLSARQARGLAAWEIAPIALTAIVAGTALGIALPWVVLGGVDLRPFTGGAAQPSIALDPVPVSAIVAGFAIVVIAAVIVAVAIGRRASAATTLRMGEEG